METMTVALAIVVAIAAFVSNLAIMRQVLTESSCKGKKKRPKGQVETSNGGSTMQRRKMSNRIFIVLKRVKRQERQLKAKKCHH